ncbi:hypothetical protein [Falsirhodobacter sp. 1013]|uniref:hypothetical protein n=1 Tax=Falsirhodobacter sp. 1013 TaxID=3417566 RepID=UPI003EC06297
MLTAFARTGTGLIEAISAEIVKVRKSGNCATVMTIPGADTMLPPEGRTTRSPLL